MNTYYPPSTDLKFVKTTREEERELFRKMKAGDADARETIIKHHLLFVAIVARKCANGAGTQTCFPDDEIVSAANEALIQAIDRKQFDETRGYRFTSYLRPFIRGAISKMWREKAKYVALPDNMETSIPGTAAFVETTEDHPVEETEFQAFMLAALESGKANLTEREQLVLSLMYEKGMNGAQIGRQLKMTRERVRQIHEEILSKLRKAMHKQGIDRR